MLSPDHDPDKDRTQQQYAFMQQDAGGDPEADSGNNQKKTSSLLMPNNHKNYSQQRIKVAIKMMTDTIRKQT